LPLLTRWWFWVGLVTLMFTVPRVKSLNRELPDRLPGEDGTPLVMQLPDETGTPFDLASIRGKIVIATTLPLASATARDETFDGIRRLRKRLRGMADAVHYVVLCHGGDTAGLIELLDERHARKPVMHYVLDPDTREWERLHEAADAHGADFLLLDRHGRVRGTYADMATDIERLITDTGHLANWAAQDLPPAR
jgi:hypothetical protein